MRFQQRPQGGFGVLPQGFACGVVVGVKFQLGLAILQCHFNTQGLRLAVLQVQAGALDVVGIPVADLGVQSLKGIVEGLPQTACLPIGVGGVGRCSRVGAGRRDAGGGQCRWLENVWLRWWCGWGVGCGEAHCIRNQCIGFGCGSLAFLVGRVGLV